jgi:hypothetical protein
MQDARGLYYYPTPANKKERMYVRERAGMVEFRLWNQQLPRIWEEHGWLPLDVVQKAARQYEGKGPSPLDLYDVDAALALIREERLKKARSATSPSS